MLPSLNKSQGNPFLLLFLFSHPLPPSLYFFYPSSPPSLFLFLYLISFYIVFLPLLPCGLFLILPFPSSLPIISFPLLSPFLLFPRLILLAIPSFIFPTAFFPNCSSLSSSSSIPSHIPVFCFEIPWMWIRILFLFFYFFIFLANKLNIMKKLI